MQTNPKIQLAAEFLETAVRHHIMDGKMDLMKMFLSFADQK